MPEQDQAAIEQAPQEPPNPYDYSAELDELEALSNELNQAQASIEGDVAKALSAQITPEMEEMFFEDREAFLLEIFKLQNQFLEQNINPKIERANALQGDITKKQAMQGIEQAQQRFSQAHPDVDINALMEFFISLPESEQARLSALNPDEFFNELYALYSAKDNVPPEAEEQSSEPEQLPTQLNGVGNNSELSESADLPMERI